MRPVWPHCRCRRFEVPFSGEVVARPSRLTAASATADPRNTSCLFRPAARQRTLKRMADTDPGPQPDNRGTRPARWTTVVLALCWLARTVGLGTPTPRPRPPHHHRGHPAPVTLPVVPRDPGAATSIVPAAPTRQLPKRVNHAPSGRPRVRSSANRCRTPHPTLNGARPVTAPAPQRRTDPRRRDRHGALARSAPRPNPVPAVAARRHG